MKAYHSIREFFDLADRRKCSPGILACQMEAEEREVPFEEVWEKMKKTIPVFRQSIKRGLADRSKSVSGLVGGDAYTLYGQKSFFKSFM